MKLIEMTNSRAIRIAELSIAAKIDDPTVYYDKDEECIYVFWDKKKGTRELNYSYIHDYGTTHVKETCNWIEIDSSFNVTLSTNFMCNMALIYLLFMCWGIKPDLGSTGLFAEDAVSLIELEIKPSEKPPFNKTTKTT